MVVLPGAVAEPFVAIAHRVVWASVASVDTRGRPRSRVMHPIWERDGDTLTGWVVSRPTPVKLAHLARTPYLTCTYWDPSHDVAVADCAADWVDDPATAEQVWQLFKAAPEPLGYDYWSVFPDGPGSGQSRVIRLTPYRIRITGIATLSGQTAPILWPTTTPA
jgi:hypothetical protein